MHDLRRRLAFCATIALSSLTVACGGGGGDDGPEDLDVIANQPAQGVIAGTSWTIGTRNMNTSGGDLNVDLLPDVAADCTVDETDGSYPFIIFFVPAAPGTYPLSFETGTVTFVDAPSSNLIVTQGVVQIDAITETTVSGGLHVFDEEFGEVNGRFDGELCFAN